MEEGHYGLSDSLNQWEVLTLMNVQSSEPATQHHGGPALAGIILTDGPDIDRILNITAQALRHRGLVVAGLVQEREALVGHARFPAMYVRNLANGSRTRISEDRGADARGCRLDWGAVAHAAEDVEADLARGADILLVNRFGKSESEGRGLRQTIEHGLGINVPTVVGVREDYAQAWAEFHGGLAIRLPPAAAAVVEWTLQATKLNRHTYHDAW